MISSSERDSDRDSDRDIKTLDSTKRAAIELTTYISLRAVGRVWYKLNFECLDVVLEDAFRLRLLLLWVLIITAVVA